MTFLGFCQMLHRLDVCTTGVLLLGRSEDASRRFSMDLQAHRVQKQYKAALLPRLLAPQGQELAIFYKPCRAEGVLCCARCSRSSRWKLGCSWSTTCIQVGESTCHLSRGLPQQWPAMLCWQEGSWSTCCNALVWPTPPGPFGSGLAVMGGAGLRARGPRLLSDSPAEGWKRSELQVTGCQVMGARC